MSRTGGIAASGVAPKATVSASPLQNAKTASPCRRSASHLAPNVTLAESPLDHFELPPGGSLEACYVGQLAPVGVGILQHLKARVFGDVFAHQWSLSQAAIEAPLQLRYRGVRCYGLREFWESAPSGSPIVRHTGKESVLVGQ
ncbi:unnamed protein product [Laminaria digitata]